MNPKIKSYLTLFIFLIIGMLLLGIGSILKTPIWLNSSFIVLGLFFIVNIITAKILHLKTDILTYWSIKKIHFLPIGIIAGGIIAFSPILIGLLAGATTLSALQLETTFTFSSVLVTLAIVTWEELWFRGIFLNYCQQNLSEINISLTIGLLFMLIHFLNPEINLLKTGPTLFFAGTFLTIVYFYFKTIWLPIGIHFGNNYLTFQSNIDKHWFLGNEGYFEAIILAFFFLLFVRFTLKKKRKQSA